MFELRTRLFSIKRFVVDVAFRRRYSFMSELRERAGVPLPASAQGSVSVFAFLVCVSTKM